MDIVVLCIAADHCCFCGRGGMATLTSCNGSTHACVRAARVNMTASELLAVAKRTSSADVNVAGPDGRTLLARAAHCLHGSTGDDLEIVKTALRLVLASGGKVSPEPPREPRGA
jgi:hypothetical protein